MFLNQSILDAKRSRRFDQLCKLGNYQSAPEKSRENSPNIQGSLTERLDEPRKEEFLSEVLQVQLYGTNIIKEVKNSNSTSDMLKAKDKSFQDVTIHQLAKLQLKQKQQQQELIEKSRRIEILENKLALLERTQKCEEILRLQSENTILRAQLNSLLEALKSHGIEWDSKELSLKINNPFKLNKTEERENVSQAYFSERLHRDSDIHINQDCQNDESQLTNKTGPSRKVRTEHLELDIHEGLVNNDTPQFSTQDSTGRLSFVQIKSKNSQSQPKLTLAKEQLSQSESQIVIQYKEGIFVEGLPFYRYYSPEAQKVLTEIREAKYPSVLKEKYPSGKLVKLIDRSHISFPNDANSQTQPIEQTKPISNTRTVPDRNEKDLLTRRASLKLQTQNVNKNPKRIIRRINLNGRTNSKESSLPSIQSHRPTSLEKIDLSTERGC